MNPMIIHKSRLGPRPGSGLGPARARVRPGPRPPLGPGLARAQARLRPGPGSGPGPAQARAQLRPGPGSGPGPAQARLGPGPDIARVRWHQRSLGPPQPDPSRKSVIETFLEKFPSLTSCPKVQKEFKNLQNRPKSDLLPPLTPISICWALCKYPVFENSSLGNGGWLH